MSRLVWDSRTYHTGVDRGVLYPPTGPGVAWDGLTAVNESPAGSETVFAYYDGQRYQRTAARSEYAATIEAYSSPVEFDQFDGTNGLYLGSRLPTFGFSYRTMNEDGYQIHLVYNATASPSEKSYISDAVESDVSSLVWDLSTAPVIFSGGLRASHMVIDSRIVWPEALSAIEDTLYGGESYPRLPTPDEVLSIFEENVQIKVTLLEDGIFTVEGPEEYVYFIEPTVFGLSYPNIHMINDVTYTAACW